MTTLNRTALPIILLLGFSVFLNSCNKRDNNLLRDIFHSNKGIPMTGSQNVPPNSSSATGTLDVSYRKDLKTLTWTITWTGLSGPPANTPAGPAIGLYGLAEPGYMAFPAPPLANFLNGTAQGITSGFPAASSGTYSNSIVADGAVVREQDILNGKFYVMIRTAAYPFGQIRGQVYFTQ
jgi:hypothetical protein